MREVYVLYFSDVDFGHDEINMTGVLQIHVYASIYISYPQKLFEMITAPLRALFHDRLVISLVIEATQVTSFFCISLGVPKLGFGMLSLIDAWNKSAIPPTIRL